jgi:hypothetical protein
MALATMTRRLAATLSAFGTARHIADPSASAGELAAIGDGAERFLHAAAAALRRGSAPPAYERHEAAAAALPALLAARISRIDLQLSIIADAATRTVAGAGSPRRSRARD